MALAKPEICAFGWKAHDFALKGVDGKTFTLAGVRGSKGTLSWSLSATIARM